MTPWRSSLGDSHRLPRHSRDRSASGRWHPPVGHGNQCEPDCDGYPWPERSQPLDARFGRGARAARESSPGAYCQVCTSGRHPPGALSRSRYGTLATSDESGGRHQRLLRCHSDRTSRTRAFREQAGGGFCKWVPAEERARCLIRELVRHGDPAEEIVKLTTEEPYDLVVLGAARRKFFEGMILGTTTLRTVRHAPCPVLTVGARAISK
jgi:hypothetical protein